MKNRVFSMQKPDRLAKEIIGLAMKIHRTLGCGFGETVYRNAFILELTKANISYEVHVALPVLYDGVQVGLFQADLIAEKKLIMELKAVEALNAAHSSQLVNYLAATNIEEGLLINFGASSLEFKTKWRTYRPASEPPDLHA
jgi:GxxExxY protein